MTYQPNKMNYPYPSQIQHQNAQNAPNPHLKDQQRMLNESLRSGYPQNITYPSQRPLPPKQTVTDASNSSKNYLSMQSSDFKSFTSKIKPIQQQHHLIPSIKPNQMNQTINVPKSTNTYINSSLANKPINYSMNQRKQDANKSKLQSIHSLTNQTLSNLSSSQIHSKPPAVQFHPSYFLLSKFPQLIPKDQIYMQIINRLQNPETKYCFHQLYINLKFLLVQSNEQFWKYLSHLHLISMNGLSDEQIREGYKLRLSLQSCLSNFSIKEFNKCVNLDEVKSSSVAISKRIYKYQNIFNSSSFQLYDKLFHTVIEFFQRIIKTRNPYEINVITSSWYLDTLKIMELATIYGSKQPSRVKQLIKNMFNLEPKLYTRDFVNFIRKLHQYIDSSVYNDDGQQAFSLLQQLNKKLQAVPNKYKHKSNFHNPQKYFTREIFFICSDCLKLFIYVTNIFKFFPSRLKLIFMENSDFLRVLIKISIRVIYNLRVQHIQKKRWKLSAKIKSLIKNLQFMLLEKITQMYKFIFLNTKNALQQQIFENDDEEQKTKEQIRQQKIILKFYKKLIEGTVNRKKDPQKDTFLTHSLNQQEDISESNFTQNNQELASEKEQNQKSQSESNENESIDLKQSKSQKQDSKNVRVKSEKIENNDTTKSKKKVKNQKIPENEYGRVLIKHLLRKQLKKDSNKYGENGYFYTNKLYNYFRQKVRILNTTKRNQNTTKRKSSVLNVSNQQEQQKSIQSIQRGFFKYLLVLEQFQQQVKQQYRIQQQANEKFRRVELIMRQLPSLEEFRKREQRIQYDQLMRRLNQRNVQYEDQPTQEEQLQMEWNQRVLDEDDFTRIEEGMLGNQSFIHFNISTQQQQKKKVGNNNNNNNYSKSIINFNTINFNNSNNNNNQSFTSIGNINLSQSQILNQWTVIGKMSNNNNNINNMRYNNNKVRYFEGESSEQLSPQQITDQQLFAQQNLSKSLIINDHNNNNSNISNILSNNNSIFKPHQQLQKLSYSMIKQQLQYFNKVKNLNWHQISRISTKNTNKKYKNNTSNNDTSQDEVLMRFNQLIKVQDIGLSFDMILGESDEQQVQQNGMSNFSYFYYNQWKHQSTRHKKKSFMEDYSWTHINQTQSNNNQSKSGNNNRGRKEQRQLLNQQSNKFKKTKKMKGQYQQQEQHQQKQLISNINIKEEQYKQSKAQQGQIQQYVRRDYANYMSNSYYNCSSSSRKYPHPTVVESNRISRQQYPQQYMGSYNQLNPISPINPMNPVNTINPINNFNNPLNTSNSYLQIYNQPYPQQYPHYTPPNNYINHPPQYP